MTMFKKTEHRCSTRMESKQPMRNTNEKHIERNVCQNIEMQN